MDNFEILFTNGLIIDPFQEINMIADIGINKGIIQYIGKELPQKCAQKTFDLSGMIVSPGLIDIHCHPSKYFSESGVDADEIGINSGVTLLCDAGTSGAYNFDAFKKLIIEKSKTKVFSFLNVANTGLVKMPEITVKDDMDLKFAEIVANENKDFIKGFKLRLIEEFIDAYGIKGVEQIKELSGKTGIPLMMHIGQTRPRKVDDRMDTFTRQAVSILDRGDIISHFLTWEPGGLIKPDGEIYPELISAKKRGVILDACHGLNHFSFPVAKIAISNGITPSVLSTDLCDIVVPSAQSLTVVMSKFLNLGLPIEQIIAQTTLNPWIALNLDETGGLRIGSSANITVLEIRKGKFKFNDGNGKSTIEGDRLIEPRFVFCDNKIIPAFSNYHLASHFS